MPLPDIIEGDEEVAITVEIPSVEKEDIYLNVADGTIEIAVDNAKRGSIMNFLICLVTLNLRQ